MAPYVGIMKGMNRRDKEIVIMFLQEMVEEPDSVPVKRECDFTDADRTFLAEKMKALKVSPRIEHLANKLRLSEEEQNDERTQYILGIKR